MSTSIKFKDCQRSQKIGYILLIIASAMKLAKMLDVLVANGFLRDDLPNYLFGIGGVLILMPHISRWIKGKNASMR